MRDGRLTSEETLAAERAILGSVLLDSEVYDLVALDSRRFAHPVAAAAWEAIAELRADGSPLDPLLITDRVPERKVELRREMATFLSACAVEVPTSRNAEHYAAIIRKADITRRALLALSGCIERARNGELDGDDLVGAALAEMAAIDTERSDAGKLIGVAVRDRFGTLEKVCRDRAAGRSTITGAPTGIPALDGKLGGFRFGLAAIVCGRPGMGKSSFVLGMSDACSAAGYGVHEFSLEDTADTRADRILSRYSEVSAQKMQRGELTQGDLDAIGQAAREVWKRKNWLVDDSSGITAEDLVRSVRRHRREIDTRVVVVDYIQLLQASPCVARAKRHEQLTHAMNVLANAAKADSMAYVVLSQLNRGLELRNDKRPMLSDLRESGSLEERAKQVLALYRGAYYYDEPDEGRDYDPKKEPRPNGEDWKSRIELLILKNANGEAGHAVVARWHGSTMRIS